MRVDTHEPPGKPGGCVLRHEIGLGEQEAIGESDLRLRFASKEEAVAYCQRHGIAYQATPWHKFEIQHYRFRMYMKRLLKKFGASAELPYAEAGESGARGKTRDAALKLAS